MASTGTVTPFPKYFALDNNGDPLVGGRLYIFAAGSTVPAVSYSDVMLSVPHSHPIILDAGGRATIFLSPGSYKFVQKDADDVLVWSVDGVNAVGPFNVSLDVTGFAGEDVLAGDVLYLETGTAGHPGWWYKADADFVARSSGAITIGMAPATAAQGEAFAVRLQGQVVVTGPLSPGAKYFVSTDAGGLTGLPPTNARFVGQADSTTSIVIAPNPSVGAGSAVDTTGVAGEAIAANQCVYLSDGAGTPARTPGQWYLTDSDFKYSSSEAVTLGFAREAIALGATGTIQLSGRVTGFNALVIGSDYFVAPTAGAIANTIPANKRKVGVADTPTSIVMSASGIEEDNCCDSEKVDYLAMEALSMSGRSGVQLGQRGGIVSSVEHVELTILAGASEGTFTLNPTGDATVLIPLGQVYPEDPGTGNYQASSLWHWRLTLTSPNTATARREAPGYWLPVRFCAVHYRGLKSVQYGFITDMPNAQAEQTATIVAVNPAKSFVQHLGFSHAYAADFMAEMFLKDPTTVAIHEIFGPNRFSVYSFLVAESW